MFDQLRGLSVVEVDANGARRILELIQRSQQKGFHLIRQPSGPMLVLLADGVGSEGFWDHVSRAALKAMLPVMLQSMGPAFRGTSLAEPQGIEEYLEMNPTLPEGKWRVFVTESMVAMLEREGFRPTRTPPA